MRRRRQIYSVQRDGINNRETRRHKTPLEFISEHEVGKKVD